MNVKVHYKKLRDAINEQKLIVIQYSSSNIKKTPLEITSFFGIDYFTDDEWGATGSDKEFREKLVKFFRKHKDYYFLIWNFNIDYSIQNLDLGIDEKELKRLSSRCIDFDDALKVYADKKKVSYVIKEPGGFDTRYYLALLNRIPISQNWIWGGHESELRDYVLLRDSSRTKTKIMCELLTRFIDGNLRVGLDKKVVAKSKSVIGIRGKASLLLRQHGKFLMALFWFLLGIVFKFLLEQGWEFLF